MDRPKLLDKSWGRLVYVKDEFKKFFEGLNWVKGDISGSKLYLDSKEISQNKIREAGFQIVRDIKKADVVVINNYFNHRSSYMGTYYDQNNSRKSVPSIQFSSSCDIEVFLSCFDLDESYSQYKYVYDSDLYKYLYKYEGNLELFSQIDELFNTGDKNNIQMAMEFMANANWELNKIYLVELFQDHWNSIRYHNYKNSISFSGFLTSLDFTYDRLYLEEANDYREYCKTEEHHNWVRDKFKEQFEDDLDDLFQRHKMKLDKLEYSIDFDTTRKDEEDAF